MNLVFSQKEEHKGFELAEDVYFSKPIVVVTGRNGSGKSRFLEAIKNGAIRVEENDILLEPAKITLLGNSSINADHPSGNIPYLPRFEGGYSAQRHETKITETMKFYGQYKDKLDLTKEEVLSMRGFIPRGNSNVFDFQSYHAICEKIAHKLKVKPSELTYEQILFLWKEPSGNVLGIQNLTHISNVYLNRIEKNEFNEFLSMHKGKDVPFLSDKEFIREFGEPPWLRLNKVVRSITDGKFTFNTPINGEDYIARLIEVNSGKVISVNGLSSGERTLMWLTLTLFNVQYYELKNQNSTRLLLLDEPDAYLHPKMVKKMFDVLQTVCSEYKTSIILTTHSPTTVALAPEHSTYVLQDSNIKQVSKDAGVTALLDGVNQITINPENQRQVYVESHYDAEIYQAIYSHLLFKTECLDPDISLNFISAGSKLPKQRLIDQAKKYFDAEEDQITEFVRAINGEGTCDQVIAQVEALVDSDNKTVRGIIDWDNSNSPTSSVSVLAEGYAYTIENLLLDPICVFLLLHIDFPDDYPMKYICGEDVTWQSWLSDRDLLQQSVDIFIQKLFNRNNRNDCDLLYLSGLSLKSDSEYLLHKGHLLENRIVDVFPRLKKYRDRTKRNPNGEGSLKKVITKRIIINMTEGNLIPTKFKDAIIELQR